jgi:hypothetical protein
LDDLGRLTREADVTLTVFKDLTQLGIRLIGVSDGFDSARPGAKLEAGLRGIMNEAYLDDLAEKTHRGLHGQFLRKFSTGGRLYGYATEEVYEGGSAHGKRDKPDGYLIKIDETTAAAVHRIFTWYAVDRLTVKEILRRLYAEGVPPPGAGSGRSCTPGWGHSSIVALLDNAAYTGRFVWNRRDWYRDRASGRRRYVERPEAEWVTDERPDLAIVSHELWEAAATRRAETRRAFPGFAAGPVGGGPGHAGGAPPRYLLSGLLRCECGATIGIFGGKGASRTYACAAHKRNPALCPNGLTISKAKVERSVIGELQRQLSAPDLIDRMSRRLAERLRAQTSGAEVGLRETRAALGKAERALANLLDLVQSGGLSASRAVAEKVESAENERDKLAAALAAIERRPKVADALPSPATVRAHVAALGDVLTLDPARGRALLERHVGRIVLTPTYEGPRPRYRASGRFVFDPGTSPKVEQVAGAGFEPATFGL